MSVPMPDLLPAYAEIFLVVMASVILIADLVVPGRDRCITYGLALLTLLGCAVLTVGTVQGTGGEVTYTFSNMFVSDYMGNLLKMLTYIAVAACLVYSRGYLSDRDLLSGEFFVLALFAMLGMMVMISANHFLTLYLGLELLSLGLYAMVAHNRDSAASTEAAMKYFGSKPQ